MMFLEIKLLTMFFILVLIVVGGIYISVYEKAPIWERIQVFAVGFGMYTGILLILWGV